MDGRSQPVDLEGLFADWLAGSGTEEAFEALCREHGEHTPALRELHEELQRLCSALRLKRHETQCSCSSCGLLALLRGEERGLIDWGSPSGEPSGVLELRNERRDALGVDLLT